MKKLILIVAVTGLAACSQPSEEDTGPDDGSPPPAGTTISYEATGPDGATIIHVIGTDGSVIESEAGSVGGTGTVDVQSDRTCFSFPELDQPWCWTLSEPGPDGTWTGTVEGSGDIWTIRRIE